MSVEMEIQYLGQLQCQALHSPSQTVITTEAPKDNGGLGRSFSPTDLMASSLGACMLTIMALSAKKEGISIDGTKIKLTKEMASKPVRKIASIKVKMSVPNSQHFTAKQKELLEYAARNCPVQKSIEPSIHVPLEIEFA